MRLHNDPRSSWLINLHGLTSVLSEPFMRVIMPQDLRERLSGYRYTKRTNFTCIYDENDPEFKRVQANNDKVLGRKRTNANDRMI